MTTIAASPLAEALQALVDARLDTIDRMLLGRVNRQDRLAIVREVESQVFDLLQRHEGGTLDRDDVLAVLAQLDPPEAYLPDEGSPSAPRPARTSVAPQVYSLVKGAQAGRLGLASGILGIVSLVIECLTWPFAILLSSELFLFGSLALAFIISFLAIVFAIQVRLRRAWAITGLVTGLMSLLALLGFGVFILIG